MKSERQIIDIINALQKDAVEYSGDGSHMQQNRAKWYKYYHKQPYGDEKKGQSTYVTGEVFETIEGMIPQLLRLIFQNRNISTFTTDDEEFDDVMNEMTVYANTVFRKKHNAHKITTTMLKDGLLQYIGILKVYQDQSKTKKATTYKNMPKERYDFFKATLEGKDDKIADLEKKNDGTYNFVVERVVQKNEQCIKNVKPDRFLIGRGSDDFEDNDFCGEYDYYTLSELREMGFDEEKLKELTGETKPDTMVADERNYLFSDDGEQKPRQNADKSRDGFWLLECYCRIDVDDDGIGEYYQFFKSGDVLLEKNRVEYHPYFDFTSILLPHSAIGTCHAEQIAPVQKLKSYQVRQMNNNMAFLNFNRLIVNENVNQDDVNAPQPNGVVRIKGKGPVNADMMPVPVVNQVATILEGMAFSDTMLEKSSGVTAYNQGMDTESLNKTATGFVGIKDMSMMRNEVVARNAANTLSRVFKRIVQLASVYNNEEIKLKDRGKQMTINPVKWADLIYHCEADVGQGAAERQERIANLNQVLGLQTQYNTQGIPLATWSKQYHTLDKLAQEIGLKDAENYFLDPDLAEQDKDYIMQSLMLENAQLKASAMNPLAEAEQIKQETEKYKSDLRVFEMGRKYLHEQQVKAAELHQAEQFHDEKMAVDITKLALDHATRIPGALTQGTSSTKAASNGQGRP